MTWNGQQLREFKIRLKNTLKYEYDANGLMTKKSKYNSSNTLDYSINYVWSDGKIVAESLTYPVKETINHVVHTTWHTLDARVVYAEGENSPCAVMFEDNEYLFVRNIWGDMVAVADEAFEYEYAQECPFISITIPETYKRIGNNNFYDCANLIAINLPHSLEFIGRNTFVKTNLCVKTLTIR